MSIEKAKVALGPRKMTREEIRNELNGFGIPAPNDILDRLVLLEQGSHFNSDARELVKGAVEVLKLSKDSFDLKPIEKMRLFLATYLGDIGKAYTPETAKLFSVENIKNRKSKKVGDVVRDHFAEEANDIEFNLASAGVFFYQTMFEFHNKHAFWTKEILDRHQDVFDEKTRIIAATHHIDSGIDPYGIKPADGPWQVSNEVRFSIYLLMAMDKYQASRVRGGENHGEAMKYLADAMRPFDGDKLKDIIIEATEQLGATDSLFTKNYLLSRRK